MSSPTVRWGLLSTARINDRLIGPTRDVPHSELLGVASRSEEKARDYARQFDMPRAYGDYDQLLADPDIDAVYVSTPNDLHAEWTVKAADAGKHVLCEKPLALTIDEVDRIEQAAQRNRVIVQEAAMMRFHPQITRVQQLVSGGAIGDVRLVRGVFTYVLENPEDVRMDPEMGGGSLWDLGSYCVRFFRSTLQQEPVEVGGWENRSDRGVDLSLSGSLRFSSGVNAHFFSSLESFGYVEVDFLGTKGRIQVTSPWGNQMRRVPEVRLIRHDGSPPTGTWDDGMLNQTVETETYPDVNAYGLEVKNMVAGILEGQKPVIPLSDSRQNTKIVLALLESAHEGKVVRV